ncbi:MAG: DNA mismatch endonuclease Vsr [Phycisphaerae bacterium]|nr:DNA mismatch endonuclease Vsr [Phycisphaerae bacterium]
MPDTLTPAQRRTCMAAIRGKDTKPELIVRSVAHRLGFRFRLHSTDLPGKPDLVFPSRRAVVFVHGCYWHMHACKRGRSTPATNAEFWREKRNTNRERDRRTLAVLHRAGWRVLVVWECQLRDLDKLASRLRAFLEPAQAE